MTEQEYKDYIYEKANNIKTKEDLDNLLAEITDTHEAFDYGKICYAISAAMLATLNYIDRSEVGGITGFQASIIGWEMIRMLFCFDEDAVLKLVNYSDMLYPQYKHQFDKTIEKGLWIHLQEQAKQKLERCKNAHPDVIKHWKKIAAGEVPFGYEVNDKEN